MQSRSTSVHIPSLIARVDMSLEVLPKTRTVYRDQVSPEGTLPTGKDAGSAQAAYVFIQPWEAKQKSISTTGICQP